MVTFLNGVDRRSNRKEERKIAARLLFWESRWNSARSENLYGTPYCMVRGALALFDGAKQSGRADFRRVRTSLFTASSPSFPTSNNRTISPFPEFRIARIISLFMEINAFGRLCHFLRRNVPLFENVGRLFFYFFFLLSFSNVGTRNVIINVFSSKSVNHDLRAPLLLKLRGEDSSVNLWFVIACEFLWGWCHWNRTWPKLSEVKNWFRWPANFLTTTRVHSEIIIFIETFQDS